MTGVTPGTRLSVVRFAGSRGMDAQIFVVLSGTGIRDTREWVPSATDALRLVRSHMKLRRPGVRIQDERGNAVSFFN
jgi:hypothetical protein